jgi:2-aminoethylphosphonate aminotransferase
MVEIAKTYSIPCINLDFNYGKIDLQRIEEIIAAESNLEYIAMIHHETTNGRLNPVKEVGELTKKHSKVFIVDAISSFAGIPFSVKDYNINFMLSTSNKCIQGMAGISFVIARRDELEKTKDYPKRSFYLNLYSQYDFFKKTHQIQFTPPVQTFYALKKAIEEFLQEGAESRYKRLVTNWEAVVKGMYNLGFRKILDDSEESKILTTFNLPEEIDFDKIHSSLYKKGFTIYPGKISGANTFRIANMGAINLEDIVNFLITMKETLREIK